MRAFVAYEIYPIRDCGEETVVCSYDEHPDFWSIYGVLSAPGGEEERVCIGDFSSEQEAKFVVDLLIGV